MKNIFMKICAFFFKRLANANYKYDQLQEPKRFYVGMGFGMGPFFLYELFGVFTGQSVYRVLALLWIILMIGLRFWWVEGNLKSWRVSERRNSD